MLKLYQECVTASIEVKEKQIVAYRAMREMEEVMRQPRKTMQRFSVDHVNSICE